MSLGVHEEVKVHLCIIIDFSSWFLLNFYHTKSPDHANDSYESDTEVMYTYLFSSYTYITLWSRDSSVGKATRVDGRGSIPSRGKFFFSPQLPDRLWGPPSLLYNGSQQFFSRGVKRPVREADHSPQSSAGVKNGRAIPPLSHTYSWQLYL
jgi:hypothetical protein